MLLYVTNNLVENGANLDARIFNLHDVFLFTTVFECLLLAVYRLAIPLKRSLDGYFLSLFMLVIAIDCFCLILIWNPELASQSYFGQQVLLYAYTCAELWRGPLFLLYVLSLTQEKLIIQYKHFLHFVWAFIAIALFAVFDVSLDNFKFANGSYQQQLAARLIWYCTILISIAYATYALILVNRYQTKLYTQYSTFSSAQFIWLRVLTSSFMLAWAWSLVTVLSDDLFGSLVGDRIGTAFNYLIFSLINVLILFSLNYTHQMTQVADFELDEPGDNNEEQQLIQIQKLINYALQKDQIYLNANLTIDQLAQFIAQPSKQVSACINQLMQTSFYELINFYRVEHAKTILADNQYSHLTILEVLMESGFNNKSSFHRFFNRFVEMSPTEFRKQYIKSD
ncbi:helix-turn-helix domain-containing protein [Catenovulum sp. SX2]|uniref:AraC family transcriptional regulator n=1 Tax=Catenovulum sp. SX2 TaxID=3398614 RepID=UPI003F82B20F